MIDPVVLNFVFFYVFAAIATLVATFGFTPENKSNRTLQMSPVRIKSQRQKR